MPGFVNIVAIPGHNIFYLERDKARVPGNNRVFVKANTLSGIHHEMTFSRIDFNP